MREKQKRFVEEYLIDLNGTQAAIRAGYSPRSAHSIATELLQKPALRDAVDKALAERSRRTGINQDRVLRELARLAFLDAADVIEPESGELLRGAAEDDTRAIAGYRVKTIPTDDGLITEREIKTYDKLKALELLGKHLGMFTDRLRMEGGVPVVITGADELED